MRYASPRELKSTAAAEVAVARVLPAEGAAVAARVARTEAAEAEGSRPGVKEGAEEEVRCYWAGRMVEADVG